MSYLVLRSKYPHEAASNALFSVKKGEILECPENYKPSKAFLVFESRQEAVDYLKGVKSEVLSPPTAEKKQDKKFVLSYPLFRRVATPDGPPIFQLFSRDIHKFLSGHEEDIIRDIHTINVHKNTAQRLLDYERNHFSRQAIMTALEAIIKGEDRGEEGVEQKAEEKVEEKMSSSAPSKGITTSASFGCKSFSNP